MNYKFELGESLKSLFTDIGGMAGRGRVRTSWGKDVEVFSFYTANSRTALNISHHVDEGMMEEHTEPTIFQSLTSAVRQF